MPGCCSQKKPWELSQRWRPWVGQRRGKENHSIRKGLGVGGPAEQGLAPWVWVLVRLTPLLSAPRWLKTPHIGSKCQVTAHPCWGKVSVRHYRVRPGGSLQHPLIQQHPLTNFTMKKCFILNYIRHSKRYKHNMSHSAIKWMEVVARG